jgi:5,10-methylenetetrahydromethanopterin reductase
MDLGVCMAAGIGDIDHAVLAEELGYSHLWVADSQMLWSDCYATLALVADRTERIRIGTGVAVAGTRSSAVTAAAHATINRIAPGRVFCGVGTGNTAMRIMGRRPMRIADFDQYLGELRSLLDGAPTSVGADPGVSIRHLMPDAGFVRFDPPIPMYVSGFGPRAMAAAVRHGDGLVMSVGPRVSSVERVWDRLRGVADELGRSIDPASFDTTNLTTMCVLEPGESADSARVREQVGAFAIAALHYQYEQ